jgi:hypothetical protein
MSALLRRCSELCLALSGGGVDCCCVSLQAAQAVAEREGQAAQEELAKQARWTVA